MLSGSLPLNVVVLTTWSWTMGENSFYFSVELTKLPLAEMNILDIAQVARCADGCILI